MLIKCIRNIIKDVKGYPDLYNEIKETVKIPGDQLHISIGKTYVVYAVRMSETFPKFFIADDVFIYYPIEYSAPFFEVVDERLSRYWQLPKDNLIFSDIKNNLSDTFLSFEEWAYIGDRFYERLVDEERIAKETFNKYKELMDLEFLIPSVESMAITLDDKWVQCPFCDEAWEIKISVNEMLKCPNCSKLLRNVKIFRSTAG